MRFEETADFPSLPSSLPQWRREAPRNSPLIDLEGDDSPTEDNSVPIHDVNAQEVDDGDK